MIVLLIVIVIVVFLLFKLFSTTAGLIGAGIGLLLIFGNLLVKLQQRGEDAQMNRSIKKRRAHLQELPNVIDSHLGALQASKTETELDSHMEALIAAMDELSSYNERLLEDAGITKSTLPQQREYAYQCYDATLAQIKSSTNNS